MAGKKQQEKTRKEAMRFAVESLQGAKEFILLTMSFDEDEDGSSVDPKEVEIAQIISASAGAVPAWIEVLAKTVEKMSDEFPEQAVPFLAAKVFGSLQSIMEDVMKERQEGTGSKLPFMIIPRPGGDEPMH